MWEMVLWCSGGLIVIFLTRKAIKAIWRFWRVLKLLNVDGLEVLKRAQDKTLEDYLKSKYKEKEELLRFQILRLLREEMSNEDDDEEKEFLQKFIGLLEDNEKEWYIIEFVKVLGGYYHSISFGRWRKVWGDVETKTVLEIGIVYHYKNGRLDERYGVQNLSDSILKEVKNLQLCRKELF